MAFREIQVGPDRFEVTAEDAILVTELHSALAVCMYDATGEVGALLQLRCVAKASKSPDVTDTTLATELLLLDRCLEALRKIAPGARHLQARIVAHVADTPHAGVVCETAVSLVRHFLEDARVRLLPEDIAAGPARLLRFRPAMGWVRTGE
jgi:chemotaxis receptor (MCP) glutamine deamidase CheD